MSLEQWSYCPAVAHEALGDYDYKELKESGRESFAPGNSSANRVFIVRWDRRAYFLDDLLGWSYLNYNGGSYGISRILPDEHPDLPLFYAVDAQVEGLGIPTATAFDTIQWTLAKVTATYKPVDYAIKPDNAITTELDRYVTRQYAFAADYLTLNGAMRFVQPPNTVLASTPGKVIGTMEITYVWHEVPAKPNDPFKPPNLTAIRNCLGRVNSVDFDGFKPQTCLCLGVDPKMVTPKLRGDWYYWEITMKVLYRDNGTISAYGEQAGHNYIWDVANGRWDLVTHNATAGGNRIYEKTDLNDLFKVQ